MRNPVSKVSPRHAALVVGIAFIVSVILVTIVDDVLLPNFVVPGDVSALTTDISSDPRRFSIAAFGYLVVLMLDAIIGLALFVVLKNANPKLALATCVLRLLYAITLAIAVVALAGHVIEAQVYADIKSLGYVFFAAHIFVLGCSVLKTNYIPNAFGALLVLASFTYSVFFF